MVRIELARQVSADPAGIALLLAGPVGRDLWPHDGVRFAPPRRTGLGFVADVTLAGPVAGQGRMTIRTGSTGPGSTEMRLQIHVEAAARGAVATAAGRFLDELADTAQQRSSAA